jgi:hypothetical protein
MNSNVKVFSSGVCILIDNCNRFSLIYQYTKFNPTTYKNNHQYNKKIK